MKRLIMTIFFMGTLFSHDARDERAYNNWMKTLSHRNYQYVKLFDQEICPIAPNVTKGRLLVEGFDNLDFLDQQLLFEDILIGKNNREAQSLAMVAVGITIIGFGLLVVLNNNDIVVGIIK